MQALFFNSSHVDLNQKSRYTLQLPNGLVIRPGDQVALQSLQVPYCVFNISSYYQNNQLGYIYNNTNIWTLQSYRLVPQLNGWTRRPRKSD